MGISNFGQGQAGPPQRRTVFCQTKSPVIISYHQGDCELGPSVRGSGVCTHAVSQEIGIFPCPEALAGEARRGGCFPNCQSNLLVVVSVYVRWMSTHTLPACEIAAYRVAAWHGMAWGRIALHRIASYRTFLPFRTPVSDARFVIHASPSHPCDEDTCSCILDAVYCRSWDNAPIPVVVCTCKYPFYPFVLRFVARRNF